MRLSLQQKEQFFHDMRELIRSGLSIAQALEMKNNSRAGATRRVTEAMVAGSDGTLPGYFTAVPEVFSEMDREIIAGGEKSGRLDDAMGYLGDYYAALAKTRRQLIVNTAYPVFILHFGALMLAIPALVSPGGGVEAFIKSIVLFLGIFYAAFAIVWFAFNAAVRAARSNPAADQFLQSIPAIGGARIALVGSRFCMLMGILVKASGSILSAMTRSASASGSALFQRGAQEAVLAIQGGDRLGAAVMRTKAFPEAIDRAFQMGETSGRLDEEMQRQAAAYNGQFQTRLEVLSFWLPKLIYIAIAAALAFRIIAYYSDYYGQVNALLQ